MHLRALIVDDEPPARARLRKLLQAEDDIDVVGECGTGAEAVGAIRRMAPQIVFLDVRIPVMDGFEVLESLGETELPAIIFVTAYDEYAVRAFDVHAVDYLLKPFSRERFREAVSRARAHLAHTDPAPPPIDQRLKALLEDLKKGRKPRARLVVKSGGRMFFIRTADIDWVEAAANYVRLHVRGESYALRESMKNMEAKLPADGFLRIHRSTIVNLDRIKELQSWFHGEYIAILQDGTKLTVSRAYTERLNELID